MRTPARGTGGFTLLEVLISATLLLLLAGSLVTALGALKGVSSAGSVESKLQEAGERALIGILDDMKRSGFTTLDLGGVNQPFPYLFDDGDATVDWNGQAPPTPMNVHSHAPATKHAQPGEPDFGPDREIVFVLPADFDGDGVPDVDPSGALVWDPQQVSYTLVTRADGINYLERRVNGANPTKVAMFVERIAFDTNASSGGVAVPLNAVRVQLFLRQTDAEGLVRRYTAQAVVRMRNG